jgi:hypothetical protein
MIPKVPPANAWTLTFQWFFLRGIKAFELPKWLCSQGGAYFKQLQLKLCSIHLHLSLVSDAASYQSYIYIYIYNVKRSTSYRCILFSRTCKKENSIYFSHSIFKN